MFAVRYGYVLEWSLSVDNIFVIALIFTYMPSGRSAIPCVVLGHRRRDYLTRRNDCARYGADSFLRLDVYVFGIILLVSAARMLRDEEIRSRKSVLVRGVEVLISRHR